MSQTLYFVVGLDTSDCYYEDMPSLVFEQFSSKQEAQKYINKKMSGYMDLEIKEVLIDV